MCRSSDRRGSNQPTVATSRFRGIGDRTREPAFRFSRGDAWTMPASFDKKGHASPHSAATKAVSTMYLYGIKDLRPALKSGRWLVDVESVGSAGR